MDKDLKKEEMEMKVERQKFQMHQKGYSDIVEAIKAIKPTEIEIPEQKEIDLSETNKILLAMVDKMNEPICVRLSLK